MRQDLETRLRDGIAALSLALPATAVPRLLDYLALLQHWNRHYNLTAVRDPQEMVTRHLLDSLAVLPWVRGASLADLGAGAGLPGIPLALAEPARHVTLVDSNGKKARFMRAALRELGIDNAEVVEARVESLRGRHDCITARAFASLPDMLQWGAHLLAPGGYWLAMKGRYPADELAALPAGFALERAVTLDVPGLDAERHLLILRRQPEDET